MLKSKNVCRCLGGIRLFPAELLFLAMVFAWFSARNPYNPFPVSLLPIHLTSYTLRTEVENNHDIIKPQRMHYVPFIFSSVCLILDKEFLSIENEVH